MDFKEMLSRSSQRTESHVVLALDIGGNLEGREERAVNLLERLAGGLACVKMNQHILLPYGLFGLKRLLRMCHEKELPVIADLKLNDIESTNLDAVNSLFTLGVDAVIANPFVGSKEGLGRVIERAGDLGKGVLLLVLMSHAGARDGYGLVVKGEPLWRIFANRARRWNADGAIVSGKSIARIREVRKILRKDQLIFCPGVGFQGGDAGRAVSAGADFVIVGRSLIDSPEPEKALQALNRAARNPYGPSRGT